MTKYFNEMAEQFIKDYTVDPYKTLKTYYLSKVLQPECINGFVIEGQLNENAIEKLIEIERVFKTNNR